jgi:nitroreductase
MNDILSFLQQRNSAPKLTGPAPSQEQLDEIFQAALRAPDHAWLRPRRFLTIEGERREAFGALLAQSLLARNPQADEAACDRARKSPLRAPLVIVVIAKFFEHPKVPFVEQRLSAGCAAQSILLATEALGFAGIWRSGDAAFDRTVMDGLGLAAQEEIIGFLYIGTREGKPKPIPALDPADFVTRW